jgi:hypothetical protein
MYIFLRKSFLKTILGGFWNEEYGNSISLGKERYFSVINDEVILK